MLTVLLYALLAIALAGGMFLLATRFLPAGEQIAPPLRDDPPWDLPPDRALSGQDVDSVRLPVSLRGYRFAETDLLLDRLAGELRARDAEIARLRGEPLPEHPRHAEYAEPGVEPEPGVQPEPGVGAEQSAHADRAEPTAQIEHAAYRPQPREGTPAAELVKPDDAG